MLSTRYAGEVCPSIVCAEVSLWLLSRRAPSVVSATCTTAKKRLLLVSRLGLPERTASSPPTAATVSTSPEAARWRSSWRRCSASATVAARARAVPCTCTSATLVAWRGDLFVGALSHLPSWLLPVCGRYKYDANFWGGAGIVGAQVPVGTGVAMANKLKAKSNWCVGV